jgi:hypothetical protein
MEGDKSTISGLQVGPVPFRKTLAESTRLRPKAERPPSVHSKASVSHHVTRRYAVNQTADHAVSEINTRL